MTIRFEHNNSDPATAMRFRIIIGSTILSFFILCAGFYSTYELGAFPDETAHLGYVLNVIDHGFPDYKAGLDPKAAKIQKLNYLKHPALYYVIVGKALPFWRSDEMEGHKRFRLANVFFSSLTLMVIYFSIRRLGLDPWSSWMGLAFVLNVPMFVILSASINNDPLMIFGCALVTSSVVELTRRERPLLGLILFLMGFVITFLTKATGALAVTIIASYFLVCDRKATLDFYSSPPRAGIITTLAILPVILYYLTVYINFGSFFPTPQGAPREWYAALNPDAVRWSLIEHLTRFVEFNYLSMVKLYWLDDFPDLAAHEFTLKVIFLVFLILVMRAIFSAWRQGTYKAITFGFSISFVVFMVIYFLTIRNNHLSTGYPAAMQARYFFGFLPAAAIILAIGFDGIKSVLSRSAFLVLLLSGQVLSFYPAYAKLAEDSCLGQTQANVHFGELVADRRFEQSFVAKDNTIYNVELLLATFIRTNTGTLTLQLIDGSDSVMASSDIKADELSDNSWAALRFGVDGVAVKPGEKYLLRLISASSKPGNAVTWWAAARQDDKTESPFIGTPYGPPDPTEDYFVQGEALVDGTAVGADFAFKIYFSP